MHIIFERDMKNKLFLQNKFKNMANISEKNTSPDKNILKVDEVLNKTEHFFEKNQKIILGVVGGILLIVGGFVLYTKWYLPGKNKDAQSAMWKAEKYFEKDSLKLALNGDGANMGFLDVISDYGATKAGTLAHYYAGICYLKQGKFQDAIDQLKEYDGDDQVVSAMSKGALGDAYMELNDNEKALELYKEAADNNPNPFSTPLFLMKVGMTYEILNNFEEALKAYERIQKEYYKSSESREIDKYIARAKGKLGKKD